MCGTGAFLQFAGVTLKRFVLCWIAGVMIMVSYLAVRIQGSSRAASFSSILRKMEVDDPQYAIATALLFWIWGLYLGSILAAITAMFVVNANEHDATECKR